MEIFKLFGSIFVNTDEADKSMQKTEKGAESIATKLGNGIKTAAKWGAGITAAALGAASAIGGALVSVTEETREYRTEMGKLESAYTTAGLSTEAAKSTYNELNAVLGDTGAAVEAANHLAQLCDNEKDLANWTDIATGVYATFGASLDIAGLTEAANHTAKLGEVQGSLADALEWAGYSVEDLNAQLATCSTEQERSKLITGTLTKIYDEAAATYKETNKDILEANKAQEKLNSAMAKIGAVAEPVINTFKNMGAELLLNVVPLAEQLSVTLLPAMMNLAEQIMPMIFNLLTALMPIITDIATTALPIIINLFEMLLPPLIEVAQMVLPAFAMILQTLMPLFQLAIDLLTPIIQIFMELTGPIVALIAGAIIPLAETLTGLLKNQLEPLISVLQIVGDNFGNVLNRIFEDCQRIIQGIELIFEGLILFITDVFTGNWEEAFQGVADILSKIFGGIGGFVKEPLNSMIDMVNGFIRGINDITIPDWVPGVGGKSISIKEIPKLYTGGLVDSGMLISTNEKEPEIIGNYGNRTLVMNNSQIIETMIGAITATMEAFIDRLTAIIGRNPEEVGDIIIPVYIGNEKIDELIVNAKERIVRRSGASCIIQI